ncbi:hypothetical protein VTN77DRAFT_6907 [Rasamsonia byssochlamydoides]|uniref:uncharacterized protein n=1 Tax=Rasamsonia byssochlamydoides TaxID=89139 RepID=UPI00374349FE
MMTKHTRHRFVGQEAADDVDSAAIPSACAHHSVRLGDTSDITLPCFKQKELYTRLAEICPQALSITAVQPNSRFVVDNFEEEWQLSRQFDFIHGRELEGSIREHD